MHECVECYSQTENMKEKMQQKEDSRQCDYVKKRKKRKEIYKLVVYITEACFPSSSEPPELRVWRYDIYQPHVPKQQHQITQITQISIRASSRAPNPICLSLTSPREFCVSNPTYALCKALFPEIRETGQ